MIDILNCFLNKILKPKCCYESLSKPSAGPFESRFETISFFSKSSLYFVWIMSGYFLFKLLRISSNLILKERSEKWSQRLKKPPWNFIPTWMHFRKRQKVKFPCSSRILTLKIWRIFTKMSCKNACYGKQ